MDAHLRRPRMSCGRSVTGRRTIASGAVRGSVRFRNEGVAVGVILCRIRDRVGGLGMRRQAALVVALMLACTGCWAQFRGDAAHTGAQPYESVVGRANVATMTPRWSATVGG